MSNITPHDAVLAITDIAINRGLHRLFQHARDQIDFVVDADKGSSLTAKTGTPSITLIANDEARIELPIVSGLYKGGTYKNVKGELVEKIAKLDGAKIAFVVRLSRLQRDKVPIHESDFTIAALYLEFTQLNAVDTTQFPAGDDDTQKIAESALQAYFKNLTISRLPGASGAPARLGLGHFAVPTVPDPGGSPMLPSHGAFSVTLVNVNNSPTHGELNFLLMMGGRPLPTGSSAGHYLTPWNVWPPSGGVPQHDGILLISDYLLLESFARPIVKKAFPSLADDGISISRGDPSHLDIVKPLDLGNHVSLTACNVQINESGQMVFVLKVEKEESLQISNFSVSVVTVILGQTRTIVLKIATDDKGDVILQTVSDNVEKQSPRFRENFEVHTFGDILKYVGALFGPIYAAALTVTEFVAQAIKSATTDQDEMKALLDKFVSSLKTNLNDSVQLPGGAVFKFGAPRMAGRLLCYDADYIVPPSLQVPSVAPFCIPEFPRMGTTGAQTPDATSPVLVGEALVSYRLITDPDLKGRQATDNPYYILRREQYWKRQYRNSWAPHQTTEETATWRIAMSKEDASSMENTTGMRISSQCRLGFKEYASAEIQAEISHELTIEVESTVREEEEKSFQRVVTHEDVEETYTVAVWTIIDRFTLLRGDGYAVKMWEFVHGDDHLEVDYYPVKSSKSGDKFKPPTLRNPLNG